MFNIQTLQTTISNAFEYYTKNGTLHNKNEISKTVDFVLSMLNNGQFSVCEKINDSWVTNQWLKKAIMLFFVLNESQIIIDNKSLYYDKIPLKFVNYNESWFKKKNIRVVPPATIRYGAFIGNNAVIMPSYVNIGAWIGEGTMLDTWSTVGSCAYVGKNVHLSGGVGIGGVLEPIQENSTIIEDNCFIGARSEIVEGTVIGKNSVISMGVYIGKNTKILDRETGQVHYGYIPPRSVVVPGSLPSKDGSHNLYCVVIVKKIDSEIKNKLYINKLLRDYQ